MEHMVDGPADEGPAADALASALHSVGSDVTPPTAQLVRGGLARGRRMKRVRQFQVVGAAAAVAVIGGGVAVVAQSGSGDSGATVAGPAAHGATTTGAPTTTPPAAPKGVMPSKDSVLDTFKALLPQGWTVTDAVTGNDTDRSGHAVSAGGQLLLNDGKGAATVYYSISSKAESRGDIMCPDLSYTTAASCTLTKLADGSQLRVDKNREYPVSPNTADGKAGPQGSGAKTWSAELLRRDGSSIWVQATDTAGEKTGDVTRSAPVLSTDQLTQIVESPSWNQVLPLDMEIAVDQDGQGNTGTPPTAAASKAPVTGEAAAGAPAH